MFQQRLSGLGVFQGISDAGLEIPEFITGVVVRAFELIGVDRNSV